MRLAPFLLVFLVGAAQAQQAPTATLPDSLATSDSLLVVTDSVVTTNRGENPSQPTAPAPPATPTVHVFGRTGLRVTLPPGWDGPATADEGRLPRLAVYTFRNAAVGSMASVVLRAEQVVGLNALEQERWKRGQMPYGYHGSRPVGPVATGLPALIALETARPGTGGAVAFLQRGPVFWALSVEAPASVWATRRDEVLALFVGIQLP